jgi:hypothetical protein
MTALLYLWPASTGGGDWQKRIPSTEVRIGGNRGTQHRWPAHRQDPSGPDDRPSPPVPGKACGFASGRDRAGGGGGRMSGHGHQHHAGNGHSHSHSLPRSEKRLRLVLAINLRITITGTGVCSTLSRCSTSASASFIRRCSSSPPVTRKTIGPSDAARQPRRFSRRSGED